jgi:hypothetical protein
MVSTALLLELFGRIPPRARAAVEGLDAEQLASRPAPDANPIGWLVWHLTRVQDHHLADLRKDYQVWVSGDWAARCGVEPDPANTGYGHSTDDVATIRPDDPNVLVGYLEAVAARTADYLGQLRDEDLDRLIDESWDPPVTVGVRLISVAADDLQHVGQAAYVRGLLPTR